MARTQKSDTTMLDFKIKSLLQDLNSTSNALYDKQNRIKVLNSIKTKDDFSNYVLNQGIGTGDPTQKTQIVANRQLTFNMYNINIIEREEPLFRKILTFKSTKPIKKGIDLNSKDMTPEEISIIKDNIKKLFQPLHDLIYQGECYGGGAALICIKGQMSESKLVQPLNYEKIQPGYFLGLKVLERWFSCVPDTSRLIESIGGNTGIDDPNLLGQPLYFKVRLVPNGKELLVHRSRLLIYNTGCLPFIEKQIDQYWGASLLERIFDPLNNYNCAYKYAINMMLISNQRVVKIDAFTDMEKATEKAKEQVKNKLELMREGLNYSNMLFISNEDDFDYYSASLQNVDKMVQKAGLNLSSKACVPYTFMFDDEVANDTTNENSYDSIKEVQETFVRQWYNVLIKVIYKSEFGGVIPKFTFEFKSIKENDENTIADILAKVSDPLIKLYDQSVINKETLIKSLGEIANNVGDVYNNFTEEFVKEHGQELKVNDQIDLARALNKGADAPAKENFGGHNNEPKETPRPKIK